MATTPRPDADRTPSLGELHLAVSRRLRTAYAGALEPYGISPHHSRALRAVREAGPIRPARLAEILRITPRSVTDVLDDLQQRDLITRIIDPTDRRAQVIQLTSDARRLLTRIDADRSAADSAVFDRLGAADRAELARILGLLARDE